MYSNLNLNLNSKKLATFNTKMTLLSLLLFMNVRFSKTISTRSYDYNVNINACQREILNDDYYNKKDSTDISIPSSYDLDIREDYHLENLQDTFGNVYLNIWGEKKHLINFEYSKLRFVDSWVQEINKATRILRKICRNLDIPNTNQLCPGESPSLCSKFQNMMVNGDSIIGNPIDLKAMNYIYKLQDKTDCQEVNLNCVYLSLAVEFMETINENSLIIFEKLQNLSDIYRALVNNQFFDRILALRNLATNHSAIADMVTENLQLQDIIDNKLETIKTKRLILEQNQRIMEYSGMWSSITAPIVSIFPSLSRTLGFTVHEAIDGLNLPNIGDSLGQTVGGVGSGLIGGLSRGLGIGWRLIIIFGFILITSYILNIFKIITDISTKFIGKNK